MKNALFGGALLAAGMTMPSVAAPVWDVSYSYVAIGVSYTLLVPQSSYGPGPRALSGTFGGMEASSIVTESSANIFISADQPARPSAEVFFFFTVDRAARVEWSVDAGLIMLDPAVSVGELWVMERDGSFTGLFDDDRPGEVGVKSGRFDVLPGIEYIVSGSLFSPFAGEASISLRLVPSPGAVAPLAAAGLIAGRRRR